jgi:hypothetical protein
MMIASHVEQLQLDDRQDDTALSRTFVCYRTGVQSPSGRTELIRVSLLADMPDLTLMYCQRVCARPSQQVYNLRLSPVSRLQSPDFATIPIWVSTQ